MITKEDFEAYLDVQMSGVTNMFNIKVVMALSSLTKEQCLDIMENYDTYTKKFQKKT